GVLYGLPKKSGEYTLTVSVSDVYNNMASKSFNIQVLDINKQDKITLQDAVRLIKHISTVQNNIDFKQKFLFEVEYFNNSWGRSHSGIYIDNKGNVCQYNIFDYEVPSIYWSKKQYYTDEELSNKYAQKNQNTKVISKNQLLNYYNLIQDASKGQYSGPTSHCCDSGIVSYVAFKYNSDYELYYP
ncbi:hypothetical protein MHK_006418, partial [Candidatus Magnetomorum sp. HK-1]